MIQGQGFPDRRASITPGQMAMMRQRLMAMQGQGGMPAGMRPPSWLSPVFNNRGMGGSGMPMMPGMPRPNNDAMYDRALSPNTGPVAQLNQQNPYLTPAIADVKGGGGSR